MFLHESRQIYFNFRFIKKFIINPQQLNKTSWSSNTINIYLFRLICIKSPRKKSKTSRWGYRSHRSNRKKLLASYKDDIDIIYNPNIGLG